MIELQPLTIRNSRWRLLLYMIGAIGFFVTILYDILFNNGKTSGSGAFFFLALFLMLALFYIRQYRAHSGVIELTTKYICFYETDYYNWQDIKRVEVEKMTIGPYTEQLVLTLHSGKKIRIDIRDLEIDGKELLELINKIEVGAKL